MASIGVCHIVVKKKRVEWVDFYVNIFGFSATQRRRLPKPKSAACSLQEGVNAED
jgi:hypothetical protein